MEAAVKLVGLSTHVTVQMDTLEHIAVRKTVLITW